MSNKIKYLLSLSILFSLHSWSQGFKMNFSNSFADCFGAVEVFDFNQPSRVQFPGNYGIRDDFIELDPYFHEVNSVWLRLEPHVEGSFEFVISTENNVDFSYFLFRSSDNSFCEKLEADRVSSLLFQNSSYRTKGAADQGGEGFKGSIETKADDIFYLMIHTNSTYKGQVTVKYKRIGKLERTQSVVQDFRRNKTGKFLRVRIRDKETGEPVEANMIINGVKRDNDLFMGTDFLFDATTEKEMHIESNTKGYFLLVKDFETKDGRGKNMEILLELERLSPGKRLALQNIKFEQDSDDFLPIAYPALKRLLDFMALNSEIRIEIQGHVNAPGMENEGRIKSLSEKRAKAVRSFLKDNGIDGDRIEVKGYGNTQMIFPEPKSIKEEEANRRVEIRIID